MEATLNVMRIVQLCTLTCVLLLFLVLSSCAQQATGQCSAEAVQKTDSTMFVKGDAFEGVLFTRNRSLGTLTDAQGNEQEVDFLMFVGLPDPATFWTPSLQEICKFEADFSSWWRNGRDSEQPSQNEIAHKFKRIDHLLRQYIGYEAGDSKKVRVAFLHPHSVKSLREWKTEPVDPTDGWPEYFALSYNINTGVITPEPLIGN